jgi:hypothetical protein
MSANPEDREGSQTTAGALQKVLDRHGYGFHYRVLKYADELFRNNRSIWLFEAAEFPVEVKGNGTRIDLILRRGSTDRGQHFYLVGECKRANPALSDWCFVRAPYTRRNPRQGALLAEEVRYDVAGNTVSTGVARFWDSREVYHIGVELRSGNQGDPSGSGRGAIEEAVTQLCRGLSGWVEFLATHRRLIPPNGSVITIPVIFTTARIWASDVDLGAADLHSGKFDHGAVNAIQTPWIWYQYHFSPGIKHSIPVANDPEDIGELFDLLYARTIAVVSSSGIENFLAASQWLSF